MVDTCRFLFLDRDGVINRRLPGAYVSNWADFEWMPGALEAVAQLTGRFDRIFVVTNQQGIGRGLMTEKNLVAIHLRMREEIEKAGGRLDGIYHCPHLASANCTCRKPQPGMALRAQLDFPEVRFSESMLVGDSLSDLQLGHRLGMVNVWIDSKKEDLPAIEGAIAAGELRVAERLTSLGALAEQLNGPE